MHSVFLETNKNDPNTHRTEFEYDACGKFYKKIWFDIGPKIFRMNVTPMIFLEIS